MNRNNEKLTHDSPLIGMAVEDVVSAKLIYDKYIQRRDNKQ